VNAAAVATPDAFVTAVVAFVPVPVKVPLAPVDGAVNVTVTPGTRLENASLTVACNCVANGVAIVALCGVPAVAVIEAAAPGVLVSEKLAGVPRPVTEAFTV
jgi:hypothetical protein